MVNRCAIVKDGIVVNIAIADPDFAIDRGWVKANDQVAIGWTYDGQAFAPPVSMQLTRDEISSLRAEAYRIESDPIFFMAQRGESTNADWLAKISEIKARFPYPEVTA